MSAFSVQGNNLSGVCDALFTWLSRRTLGIWTMILACLCIVYNITLYYTLVDTNTIKFHGKNSLASLGLEYEWEKHQTQIRNLPPYPFITGWDGSDPRYYGTTTCAKYPTLLRLRFNNVYWQVQEIENRTLYLYSAFLDTRIENAGKNAIRILGMMSGLIPPREITSSCQIWFEKEPHAMIVPVVHYKWIYANGMLSSTDNLEPCLLSCILPPSHQHKVPESVSVVASACAWATNNVRVYYDKPTEEKKDFAVCVKGLNYPSEDLSLRLIEWIELLRLLGADKIYFYEFNVHPNMQKALRYYEKKGEVGLTPLTLPGDQPNHPQIRDFYFKTSRTSQWRNELIPYNDCFYRILNQYKYIAILDIDEVIMPVNAVDWKEMMAQILFSITSNKQASSVDYYFFRNIYFLNENNTRKGHEKFRDIPYYLHMLQHVYRSKKHSKVSVATKSIINPKKVLTVHNHVPVHCIQGACEPHAVPVKYGQLQHYRVACGDIVYCPNMLSNAVIDTNVWRYKDALIQKTTQALLDIGVLPHAEEDFQQF